MRRRLGLGLALVLCALASIMPLSAATAFADLAFQAQWQQGEALIPNFWGPLATATGGQQEPYKEAAGGRRLVQYFDKGRMELTNGTITNGLLATELVRGQVQTGDAAFQPQSPPAIPIVGDPDNAGPTYAQLATTASPLFDAAPDQMGAYTQAAVSASGSIAVSDAARTDAPTFAIYDTATQHNVPKAFADYRTKAGLLTIGYALCEPFYANVMVAGVQQQVMVQVFERRVLTYTAANPAAFQVEMGNIGQHYYQWRYPTGQPQMAPATTSPSVLPTATPSATAVATVPAGFTEVTSPVARGGSAEAHLQTMPGAMCTIAVMSRPEPSSAAGLGPQTANASGMVVWTWMVGTNTTPGTWPIEAMCTLNSATGKTSSAITVT
jgi:hypothetical protein